MLFFCSSFLIYTARELDAKRLIDRVRDVRSFVSASDVCARVCSGLFWQFWTTMSPGVENPTLVDLAGPALQSFPPSVQMFSNGTGRKSMRLPLFLSPVCVSLADGCMLRSAMCLLSLPGHVRSAGV